MKRILALLDGPEQEVVYGTVKYDDDGERATIFIDDDPEQDIRVDALAILEVTEDNRQPA
jgi:hypothetical protein